MNQHMTGGAGFRAILLPLLLTLLPVVLLHRGAERESLRAVTEADEAWFARTKTAAHRLSEASHPRFWAERGLRRVRRDLERRLRAGDAPSSPEAVTLDARGWEFWACSWPASAAEDLARAIVAPGFATAGQTLMTQALREIARALAGDDEASRAARAGEVREVVVLFAGLAGFTPPLGKPLSTVVPAALAASRAMRRAFPELRDAAPTAASGPVPHLGIGLVGGPVLAGILGAETVRLEFTVIGDTVNLASRLSDLAAKQDGGAILIAGDLVRVAEPDTVDRPRFQRLETSTVKGKTRAVEIFHFEEN